MYKLRFLMSLATIAVFTSGCAEKSTPPSANSGGAPPAPAVALPPAADEHAHAAGPHHGTLVELGKEEFHAEVVHDAKSVIVYMLDSSAKNAVPIDATEVVINILHDGKPEQFKLAPSPEASEPFGKSSKYTLADDELAGHIDDESAAPKLSVAIGGTSYRGEIKHDHDVGGHGHAH